MLPETTDSDRSIKVMSVA